MNKKGFELSLIELIKLFFAFIIIVGVFIPLSMGIYNFFTEKPDQQTLTNLATLSAEVKALEKGDSITVPIYIEDKFVVITFNEDGAPHKKCRGESCLCLYQKEESSLSAPVKCQRTGDIKYKQNEEKVIEGDSKPENVEIKNEEGVISIA